jgi:hypothetical protein
MRIFDYQPRACRVPFAGLFVCTDSNGNKLLRMLEPPKHDAWDPKRVDDDSGKKALTAIKEWIRDEVKKLNPFFSGKSFDESDLAKYLPDSGPEEDTGLPDDNNIPSEHESLEPKPRQEDRATTPVRAKPVATVVVEGSAQGPGSGSEGGGGGNADGEGTGGDRDGTGPGDSDQRGGAEQTPEMPQITARSYFVGNNVYNLVLRSTEDFSGSIGLVAKGEDGKSEPTAILSASTPTGAALRVAGGRISDIRIKSDLPTRISVKINALERRALMVTGYR